jgi:Rieske Fe-S protein
MQTPSGEQRDAVDRRAVIGGVGLAALTAGLSACGGDGGSGSTSAPSATPAGGGTSLAKTGDIPAGGGKIFAAQKVVVTQPAEGQFKAFSSTCTHMGCTVSTVAGGTINCPCHGSKYRIADGSVAAGPAPRPLPVKNIKVAGEEITLA